MNVFFASHWLLLMSYDRMLFRHHGAAESDPANVVLALAVFFIVVAFYFQYWYVRRPWYVMRRYRSGGPYARR